MGIRPVAFTAVVFSSDMTRVANACSHVPRSEICHFLLLAASMDSTNITVSHLLNTLAFISYLARSIRDRHLLDARHLLK